MVLNRDFYALAFYGFYLNKGEESLQDHTSVEKAHQKITESVSSRRKSLDEIYGDCKSPDVT